jgi:phosphoenolpyruvate-protein phosphotransferase
VNTENLISENLIQLNSEFQNKEEALHALVGLLIQNGSVDSDYLKSILERESVSNTYLGSGVAIPHGMGKDKNKVFKNSIAIIQVPNGVEWSNGNKAHLIYAIAANSDHHINILKKITRLISNPEELEKLKTTRIKNDFLNVLNDINSEIKTIKTPINTNNFFNWTVTYPGGLHARPASSWVEVLNKYNAEIFIEFGQEQANAKSLISILQLGLEFNSEIKISARGPDAAIALSQLQIVIKNLEQKEVEEFNKNKNSINENKKSSTKLMHSFKLNSNSIVFDGVGASHGIVVGKIYKNTKKEIVFENKKYINSKDLAFDFKLLDKAITETFIELKELAQKTSLRTGDDQGGIFTAQSQILRDPDLFKSISKIIADGNNVFWSWRENFKNQILKLQETKKEVFIARAADLKDVCQRVLEKIDIDHSTSEKTIPENSILISHDLTPSETAKFDQGKIIGFATVLGGPTSHVSILARTLGIPAIVGLSEEILRIEDGAEAILDGINGYLYINPSSEDLSKAKIKINELEEVRIQNQKMRNQSATTKDGVHIEIAANINTFSGIDKAIDAGAESIGLMRTEFLFLERKEAPTEDEQFEIYSNILKKMNSKNVIIRTLDIGGDKQVPYLNLPIEQNPFLGIRGARLCLRRLDLFIPQLRALYRASEIGKLSIMFPMVSTVEEIIEIKKICEEVRISLNAKKVPLGIMVEMPSVAVMTEQFAPFVDFFSVGTNDLTQYTLAMDREHAELSKLADSLHPSVINLIKQTVDGAKKHGVWVGVCGGLASHLLGAKILVGLGVNELSMSQADIPSIKTEIRKFDISQMQKLAEKALKCSTVSEVKNLQVEF